MEKLMTWQEFISWMCAEYNISVGDAVLFADVWKEIPVKTLTNVKQTFFDLEEQGREIEEQRKREKT